MKVKSSTPIENSPIPSTSLPNKQPNPIKTQISKRHRNKKLTNSGTKTKNKEKLATNKNMCITRRNPYKIYTEVKKSEFYKKLNEEYDKEMGVGEFECSSKSVKFEDTIQIKQYSMEEEVSLFLTHVTIKEQVNEEENKLDA